VFLVIRSLTSHTSRPDPQFELVLTVPQGTEQVLSGDGLRSPTEVWVEMISGAKFSILLGQFYVTAGEGPDDPVNRVISELQRAVDRGVSVRFLADDMMMGKTANDDSGGGRQRLQSFLEGGNYRAINYSAVTAQDSIHHAKYMVVDDREAFVGSQNFDWRALALIHELGVRTTNQGIVNDLTAIFEHDWQLAEQVVSNPTPEEITSTIWTFTSEPHLVASPLTQNPRGVSDSEAELVQLIVNAKTEITIQVMEYSPFYRDGKSYPVIERALEVALQHGVKVRLLVNDKQANRQPALASLQDLASRGAQVRFVVIPPELCTGIPYACVAHSKYMVIDGRVLWLGTSNWAGGYLDRSRNVEVVLTDPGLSDQALRVYSRLWDSPYAHLIVSP